MSGSPGVQIEDATTGDVGAIRAVRAASWRAAYSGIIDQGFLDRMSGRLPVELADRIPACLDEVALVARDRVGQVMGFSIARASNESGVGEVYLTGSAGLHRGDPVDPCIEHACPRLLPARRLAP